MSAIIKSICLIIILLYPISILSTNNILSDHKYIEKDSLFINDSIRARDLLNDIGYSLYLKDSYSQALDSFSESLIIRKRIYGENSDELARAYEAIAMTYSKLRNFGQALKNYDLAEESYSNDKFKNISRILNLYNNIGNVYREKLDYTKALQYYQQALALYKEYYVVNNEDIAYYNYPIAEIYYLTNEYEKALNIINENINNSSLPEKIGFSKILAYIDLMQGHNSDAQKNYQNFIDLIILNSGENSIDLAEAYLQYASFLISNSQFPNANDLLNKAENIIDNTQQNISIERSEFYKQRGYYWYLLPVSSSNMEIFGNQKIQNLNKAIDLFNLALKALNFPENYSESTNQNLINLLSLIEAIKVFKLIADSYSEITNVELSNNEDVFPESLNSAIETYKIVGSLIQRARKELTTDDSKIQLTSLEYSSFYKMIQAASLAYKISNDEKYIDLAFQNAERVKSSSVYDKISDEMALENSAIPDSLLTRENSLNNKITEYSEKLFNEQTQPSPDITLINQYNDTIFSINQQLGELNRYLESEYSDYYQLKYSSLMSSINDIQNLMNQDQVILEYVMNESDTLSELYTFTISKNKIGFYNFTFSPDFIKNIETMFGFVSSDNYLFTQNDDSKKFCVSSFKLYQVLIAPYLDEIKDKNITIIPDGKLSYIPFDALLFNLPDTSETIQFNHLDYLIRDYNINYSNSANLLFSKKPNKSIGNVNALSFAPDYNMEKFMIGSKEMTLLPLPGVQQEVEKISEIVNSKVYSKDEATEENFRKNVGNYDILHLAMHAFINDSIPAFSSLAFKQLNTADDKEDGLLNTADIYNLKLKAKLTVLSACNTGTGQLQKGEGILSLARGFLYAGCPSIIMSLWEVEDQSGTQIMSSFYRNLKKGKRKDEALRAAKLEYLESAGSRKAHPHYWLSFVSIGDNSSLYVSYDYYFFVLLILAFAGIAIDQIVRIKKARKKQAL